MSCLDKRGEPIDVEAVFSYLDRVNATGKVNMSAAYVLLQAKFGASEDAARYLVRQWMSLKW